jgi:hypothetical protein
MTVSQYNTLGKTMDNPEPDMEPTCFYMDRDPQKIGLNICGQECNLPPTISFNVETKMLVLASLTKHELPD